MYDEPSGPCESTAPWAAQLRAIAETAAALRRVDHYRADRQALAAQRATIARAWEQTQAQLTDLLVERDDARLALAQARAEQRLGVPCMALGALEARLEACQAAVESVQAGLAQVDELYDTLNERIRALGTTDERQG